MFRRRTSSPHGFQGALSLEWSRRTWLPAAGLTPSSASAPLSAETPATTMQSWAPPRAASRLQAAPQVMPGPIQLAPSQAPAIAPTPMRDLRWPVQWKWDVPGVPRARRDKGRFPRFHRRRSLLLQRFESCPERQPSESAEGAERPWLAFRKTELV